MYAYLESRTAYFMPGVIFLALVRDALNLVSSPENLGRQVFLKGDLVESYYGICGLKNVREFEFK